MEKEVKQKLIRCVSGSRYWAEIKDTSRLLIHTGKMLWEGKTEIFQVSSGEARQTGGEERVNPLSPCKSLTSLLHLSHAIPSPYWQGEGLAQDHLPLLGLQDKDWESEGSLDCPLFSPSISSTKSRRTPGAPGFHPLSADTWWVNNFCTLYGSLWSPHTYKKKKKFQRFIYIKNTKQWEVTLCFLFMMKVTCVISHKRLNLIFLSVDPA